MASLPKIMITGSDDALKINQTDFPVLIHGADGSGASLFSVALIAGLVRSGKRIVFFTAFPMAREELMAQLTADTDLIIVKSIDQIASAANHQVIIVKSGDTKLFTNILERLNDLDERTVFVKNIEILLTAEIYQLLRDRLLIILSDDLDKVEFGDQLTRQNFSLKVLFSESKTDLGVKLPRLPQYAGFMTGTQTGIVKLQS